jgi:hypothetical protein
MPPSFDHLHVQDVLLPDGRTWTVRVERFNEALSPEGALGWATRAVRWAAGRMSFLLRPGGQKLWRVLVLSGREQVTAPFPASASYSRWFVPEEPLAVVLNELLPTKTAAATRADALWSELHRSGELPPGTQPGPK